MPDRDPRQHPDHPSDAPDGYRPFNDPKHPSWYTDASAPTTPPTPDAGHAAAARNPYADQPLAGPYADQPLAGPYGNGQPQYPIHGGYPVLAQPPGRTGGWGHDGDASAGTAQPGGPAPHGRQAGPPFPAPARGSSASGTAIASMVLGIVGLVTGGFLVIPQILAVILGHIGLKDPRGRGFAVAGLVMGYVVIGLWLLGVLSMVALTMSFS
jgi:hypothetical protein